MTTPTDPPTFTTILTHLSTTPAPLFPPSHPHNPTLTPLIASALLHPTLEAALHILNHDLPSAHFLVRHMQSPPAFEGMFLHGILHRVEGDYDNARAWYGNVAQSEVFGEVWGSEEGARGFIGSVEECVRGRGKDGGKGVGGDGGEGKGRGKEELEKESRREIETVLEWCRKKFGEERWVDASSAWVQPSEEHRRMGEEMVSGGKGFREF